MGVMTDITLVPKNNSLINSAKVSELILDALEALNCLTDIKHHHEHFDRKIGMRFINDVMIGRIPLFYPYKEGDVVKKGQTLMILEAMKMENNILASTNGTISQILVAKGDSVLEGADLVIID